MSRLKHYLSYLIGLLPDELYLRIWFYHLKGDVLHLKNPKRYTEKIQWLKLHGDLERFARYADKYTVRSYIEEKIGAEYLIPLLGAWNTFDEIPFDTLPKRFVLKVTNGCGYNFICKDKAAIDYASLRATICGWQKEKFYRQGRERQYKPCKPRIICEAYMEDDSGALRDYKFFCSKGEPRIIQYDADRYTSRKNELLYTNWKRIDFVETADFGRMPKIASKPKELPQMLALARKLSQDFPFVRVDLYLVNGKIYFGELTFTPGSGFVDLRPVSGDIEFGKLVDLAAYAPVG